jgi:hypothetical protein
MNNIQSFAVSSNEAEHPKYRAGLAAKEILKDFSHAFNRSLGQSTAHAINV